MLAENVIQLNQNEIYKHIQNFLKAKGYKSDKTKMSYEKDIKRFFYIMRNKELHFLTLNDIQVTLEDFDEFIAIMKDKNEFNNKTINHNVTSVTSLLKYLHSRKIDDEKIVKDISYIGVIEFLPENKNPHGVLSVDEVHRMAELALKERNKGEIKSKLILFCLDTCMRKNAALNLKWSDFEERDNEVLIKAIDKGNKDFRPKIAKWFFNELLTLKTDKSDTVFDISERSINDMMKNLREKMNIPEERNIVFHSFRKAGAMFQYRLTGDLKKAQAALGHSNVSTTDLYLEDEKEGIMGAVSSAGDVDINAYKYISHEELLNVLDNLPKNLKYILACKISELVK